MAKRFYYLVSYDIGDPKILRQAAKYLESQGVRLQKSVFLLYLPQHRVQTVKKQLETMVGEAHQVMLTPLCGRCMNEAVFLGERPGPSTVF